MRIHGVVRANAAEATRLLSRIGRRHGLATEDLDLDIDVVDHGHTQILNHGHVAMRTSTATSMVTVTLPDPILGGWSVLARLRWASEGGIEVVTLDYRTSPTKDWASERAVCSQCTRTHQDSPRWVLARAHQDEVAVVAGHCLELLTGADQSTAARPLSLAHAGLDIHELLDGPPGAPHQEMATADVFAWTARVIRRKGWAPPVGGSSTSSAVRSYMKLHDQRFTPTHDDRNLAAGVTKWVQHDWHEHSSHHTRVREFIDRGWVPDDQIDFDTVTTAVADYHRQHTQPANPDPVPVGDATTIEGVVVLYGLRYWGWYGPKPVMTVQGDEGWNLTGTIPRCLIDHINLGARIRLVANTSATADPPRGTFKRPRAAELIADPDPIPTPDERLWPQALPQPRAPSPPPPRKYPHATKPQIDYIRGLLDDFNLGDGVDTTHTGPWAMGLIPEKNHGGALTDLHIADASFIIATFTAIKTALRHHRLELSDVPDETMAQLVVIVRKAAMRSNPVGVAINELKQMYTE